VHLARPESERGAGSELLGSAFEMKTSRAFRDPDDLVVQVVVPRRFPRRDEAREECRAGRSVVRPEEDLERAALVADSASASSSEVTSSAGPMGAWRSAPAPTVATIASSSAVARAGPRSRRGRRSRCVP
jgi:hypothetical protein